MDSGSGRIRTGDLGDHCLVPVDLVIGEVLNLERESEETVPLPLGYPGKEVLGAGFEPALDL